MVELKQNIIVRRKGLRRNLLICWKVKGIWIQLQISLTQSYSFIGKLKKMRFIGSKRDRANWLRSGDKNTSFFFHRFASLRKRTNMVKNLEMEDGCLIDNSSDMAYITRQYFENIFSSQSGRGNLSFILDGVEECISTDDNMFLTVAYIEEEVFCSLKDMGPLKAPGCDGFSAFFF